jgi:hypothetical protein
MEWQLAMSRPIYIEQSPWEAYSRSAGNEIPRLVWNPKVHFQVYKSTPVDPILSQINPVQTTTPYFFKIYSNSIFRHFSRKIWTE